MRTEEHRQIVRLVLRQAKTLHRTAVSDSLAASLPVLRRLLSAQVIQGMTLPQLSRQRHIVQRKHVLRTLAIEAGYSGWDTYRSALLAGEAAEWQSFDSLRLTAGYPNAWFSSMEDAEGYAAVNGGRAIRVGQQAVVLAETPSAG